MMDERFGKLASFLMYYGPRAVGHTELMLQGINNYDKPCVVIAKNMEHAIRLSIRNRNALPLSMANVEKLQGLGRPVAVDHFVISLVVRSLMETVRTQDILLDHRQREILKLKERISNLESKDE